MQRFTDLILNGTAVIPGNMQFDRQSHCPCKNGPKCDNCSYCLGCSCRCHSWFTLHTRFFAEDQEKQLLRRIEKIANSSAGEGVDNERRSLVLDRLKHAKGEIEPPPATEETLEGEVAPPAAQADNHTRVASERVDSGDGGNGHGVSAQQLPVEVAVAQDRGGQNDGLIDLTHAADGDKEVDLTSGAEEEIVI